MTHLLRRHTQRRPARRREHRARGPAACRAHNQLSLSRWLFGFTQWRRKRNSRKAPRPGAVPAAGLESKSATAVPGTVVTLGRSANQHRPRPPTSAAMQPGHCAIAVGPPTTIALCPRLLLFSALPPNLPRSEPETQDGGQTWLVCQPPSATPSPLQLSGSRPPAAAARTRSPGRWLLRRRST